MRTGLRAVLFLSALAGLAAAPGDAGRARAAEPPAAVAARLGRAIASAAVDHPRSPVDWGRATGVVDAPFEAVVATVRDYAGYADLLPFFTESRVLEQAGDRARVHVEARIAGGLTRIRADLDLRRLPPRGGEERVRARMVTGNAERLDARFRVAPLDDGRRALLTVQVLLDPDLPLVSAARLSEENLVSARRTIRAVREKLER